MTCFKCPVCGGDLVKSDKSFVCPDGHSFDIAKKGHINLLMSQERKDRTHGDDKDMVIARKNFLNLGCYDNLMNAVAETAAFYAKDGSVICDAGCGEGYYTQHIFNRLKSDNIDTEVFAFDISKNAMEKFSLKDEHLHKAVASIFDIPLGNSSCDMLINIFAPYCDEEFKRILKKGGIMQLAIPLENHLWELKEAIYDAPYKNEVKDTSLPGFEFLGMEEIKYKIHLDSCEDIKNLFTMTPYYYKTSREDIKKLDSINNLDIKIEFGLLKYKKL